MKASDTVMPEQLETQLDPSNHLKNHSRAGQIGPGNDYIDAIMIRKK